MEEFCYCTLNHLRAIRIAGDEVTPGGKPWAFSVNVAPIKPFGRSACFYSCVSICCLVRSATRVGRRHHEHEQTK